MRVAVLFSRLGPYHHARLNAAGRIMDLHAVEACALDATYAWEKFEGAVHFQRITVQEKYPALQHERREFLNRMFCALDKINPDVVAIPGWSFIDALSGLAWGAFRSKPMVMLSESTPWDEPRKGWKEWMKRQIVGLGRAALVGGMPHKEYMRQLGMPEECLFLGYDAVDNGYFAQGAQEVDGRKEEIRSRHGLPSKYFLASARFIEKKNLARLVQAYSAYRRQAEISNPSFPAWDLVLLGDGALRDSLVEQIHDLNLGEHIHLPGFKQYPDLPAFYGCAQVFIHASTVEQWGLVVNEAMASGLPVLVSTRCGCAHDLVREGVNGFTFDPHNAGQLAALMLKVSSPAFPLAAFGSESQRIIADWGPELFAAGLKAASEKALAVGPKKASLLQRFILNALLFR